MSPRHCLLALGVLLGALLLQPGAACAAPAHTDIMLVFDTSGSMEGALSEASAEIEEAMAEVDSRLPDVAYGLAEVRDYGGSEYDEEEFEDLPWKLDVPITSDRNAVTTAIDGLDAHGGGDEPEAYGRALWETDTNPQVGWRPGATHLIFLIADNMPHDNDLNDGIPTTDLVEPSPWDTGEELPEAAGVSGTVWTPGTNLDWQAILQQLAADGKPLEFVDYQGASEYLPYWENWAGRTGGEAVLADAGEFVEKFVGLTTDATRGPCAPVTGSVGKRLVASLKCSAAMTSLEVQCGVELSLGKVLKGLVLAKGLIDLRKVKKAYRPLARLVNTIRSAKFLRGAPAGFRTPEQVLSKIGHVKDVIDLIRLLPEIAKSVSRADFKQIALEIGDLAGARACVKGLLLAVE
ncbi:MAG: vWA domain-containing protein [Solirubrobacterales bacterium]